MEVGLVKKEDGKYNQYTTKKKGWLKHLISQPSEATDAVSVGEIASELEMTARPEHDRDDDDPEDAEDGADDERRRRR